MAGQFAAEAAGVGDEVDDALDALHVALFSPFDLRIDFGDDVGFFLLVVATGEVFEDAEAVDDAAGLQLDGAGAVPFLEFPYGVGAGELSSAGGGVDVDAGPFLGGFA